MSQAPTKTSTPQPTPASADVASIPKSSESTEISNARKAFMKHSTVEANGDRFMDFQQFLEAVAPVGEDFQKFKREHYALLFRLADQQARGKVTAQEFIVFNDLLCRPDAEYEVAFRTFDARHRGKISLNDFKATMQEHLGENEKDWVDYNSQYFNLYFSNDRDINYKQFSQFLKGLKAERLRQGFVQRDEKGKGRINSESFEHIILDIAKHKMSDYLIEKLPTLCNVYAGAGVTFATVVAFHNVVQHLDTVERVVRAAIAKSRDGKISKGEFLKEASRSRFGLFTPTEVDVIFHFAGDATGAQNSRLGLSDFARVLDPKWGSQDGQETTDVKSGFGHDAVRSAWGFILGSIAGAVGATVVYPIDLVKTRMQNQRTAIVGELLYKNSLDCFRKVLARERFRGLYSGLGPQLIGVAPEKAIKLTMNDLVRKKLSNPDGSIKMHWEVVAGCVAGGSQVVFTNPLEIVKIRLQIQGEALKTTNTPSSAVSIVRQLGIFGLYKGSAACLLRDVPFSGIYFTCYSHLKKDVFGESPGNKIKLWQLLVAGAVAGMPAAYLTTPADVIKTRIQVEAKSGESTYNGLMDAARKIYREEGPRAFFKGGSARILRSSPQFGTTLMVYEFLQSNFDYDSVVGYSNSFLNRTPFETKSGGGEHLPNQRFRNGLKVLMDVSYRFGRVPEKLAFNGVTLQPAKA